MRKAGADERPSSPKLIRPCFCFGGIVKVISFLGEFLLCIACYFAADLLLEHSPLKKLEISESHELNTVYTPFSSEGLMFDR